MKRYRLKKEVKRTILILLIVVGIFCIVDIIKRSDDNFIESCTKAGYSIEHCNKNK